MQPEIENEILRGDNPVLIIKLHEKKHEPAIFTYVPVKPAGGRALPDNLKLLLLTHAVVKGLFYERAIEPAGVGFG
ncbi:MAG TPA: hypothetical protein VMO20_01485, partial [Candidatus Acidoferrum sp.]|nr:hypothetical protein [Candidatus Acidoferrum sp.]